MMQNQERRQRRLSNLSTGTGNTNKTSSTQRAENSTTAVGSAKATSDVTFHGRCVIHGGQFSNSINSLNQSLKLAVQEAKLESSPKRYKRLKVLDSDFD